MQEGCGALKEHLYGCAKERQPVEVQPKTAADEAETVMKKKGQAANSAVEHQSKEGVIDEVAVHDAAPEEVAVCTIRGARVRRVERGGITHAPEAGITDS